MPVQAANDRSAIGRCGPSAVWYGATIVTNGGSSIDAEALGTPGTDSLAGTTRLTNARIAAGSAYFMVGNEMRIETRPAALNPAGACRSFTKLLSNRPAPTRSISDSATS